ncbi:YhgE/Pip family protein [Streptomyces sp. NPDC127068]|uniref:YhgE/Pip family protein n=1 Tax=Streptomyces sp. NPDC127068 TaxID=3347127 RepID=UPI003669D096
MRPPRLAVLELRRFGRGRLPRAALVAVLVLPLLYGALYLWSFWDPYSRMDRVPVALVNEDEGSTAATAAGERIAVGDEIAGKLRDGGAFQWHEVDARQAREGVADGRYHLSLTIPARLSERIAGGAGDSPEASALKVRTNDANNYLVGQLSRSVFAEVRRAASADASRQYLDRMFVSFSDLHGETERAAGDADALEGGIGKAKQGAEDLADGLRDAKDGSGDLAGGLGKLTGGALALETGTRDVADGTRALVDEVSGAAERVRPFLKDDGRRVEDTARAVAGAAGTLREHLEAVVTTAPAARTGTREAADALDSVYERRCAAPGAPTAAGTPPPAPQEAPGPQTAPGTQESPGPVPGATPQAPGPDASCADLKKARDESARAARLVADVDTVVTDLRGDTTALEKDLTTLQTQAEALADAAPTLSKDLDDAVTGVTALDEGAQKVADGAADLQVGLTAAATGSADLDAGVERLKTGAGDLDGGLFPLVDGAHALASGLHDGAGKIPDHSADDRDRRTEVMADPVRLAAESVHRAANYGTGFAPYFIPLSLWVGVMVAYMVVAPLNRRALAAGAPAWRVALAGWLPVAALGALQTGALMSVLHWGLGLQLARAAGTVAFLLLVTGCFAAIVQWLNARFGAAGRILVLAMLMLQLTSAGGTYPVQTSPGFFQAIHPFLPMTHVVAALRRLITGGDVGPVWQACAVLLAFTAGALALTALTARRRQSWTLDRLHPELSL